MLSLMEVDPAGSEGPSCASEIHQMARKLDFLTTEGVFVLELSTERVGISVDNNRRCRAMLG